MTSLKQQIRDLPTYNYGVCDEALIMRKDVLGLVAEHVIVLRKQLEKTLNHYKLEDPDETEVIYVLRKLLEVKK